MRPLVIIFTFIFLIGCSNKTDIYICKDTYQIPTNYSLKIEKNKLTYETEEFKLCESRGNVNIYHKTCKKNEYGNYESSIVFDSIKKELLLIGSGGIAPRELLYCSRTN